MALRTHILAVLVVAAAGPTLASPELAARRISSERQPTICELIEAAADTHELPVGFLTRLIWKESSFRRHVVSPKGAQGIAQFMPATAARRGLADPFDPVAAIPASAHYLRDLRNVFGNLGFAAAAYNAGEERVSAWLAGTKGLPRETRDYVAATTGRTAETWARRESEDVQAPEDARDNDERPRSRCLEIAALLAKPGAGSATIARLRKADWAPWGVQVAGGFSVDRVMASYAAVRERHASLISSLEPMVVTSVRKSRGSATLYEARVPQATREEADRLCADLRSDGGACVVFKSEP